MDPTVLVAVVGAAGSLLAHPVTWVLGRRSAAAAAELTDAQAERVRTEIWTQLQTSLASEVERLQGQLTQVMSRLALVEAALMERSAQLRATEIERDALRTERAALAAERDALRVQLLACRSCTVTTIPDLGRD